MVAATMTRYRKTDVQTHPESGPYSRWLPAVNVKIYSNLESCPLPFCIGVTVNGDGHFVEVPTNPHFTHAWVREHLTEAEIDSAYRCALEIGWENLQWHADEVFADWHGVKVWSAGRSGGWCVVTGLPEVASWDAVMLSRWRRFEKAAEAERDDIWRRTLDLIYTNEFMAWVEA